MTDGEALLAAVLANPKEDTPRLVYADYLDENGNEPRAEFIRVQIELARFPLFGLGCLELGVTHTMTNLRGADNTPLYVREWDKQRFEELRRRVQELWDIEVWQQIKLLWTHIGCDVAGHPYLECMRRGFVSNVTCTTADWLAHADELVKHHPIEKVTLTTPYHQLGEEFAALLVERDGDVVRGRLDQWPGVVFEMRLEQWGIPRMQPVIDAIQNVRRQLLRTWPDVGLPPRDGWTFTPDAPEFVDDIRLRGNRRTPRLVFRGGRLTQTVARPLVLPEVGVEFDALQMFPDGEVLTFRAVLRSCEPNEDGTVTYHAEITGVPTYTAGLAPVSGS